MACKVGYVIHFDIIPMFTDDYVIAGEQAHPEIIAFPDL
jgi:hypothetical protein